MRRSILWVFGGVVTAAVAFASFVWAFRTKSAPVQGVIRRFNRDVTNRRQLSRSAGQPDAWASIVEHVGRRSGTPYRTPVVAVPDGDGFVVALPYGPDADWVRNVLAAGTATVVHEGERVRVGRPTLVATATVAHLFPPGERRTQRLFGVRDILRLDRLDEPPSGRGSRREVTRGVQPGG